MGRMNMMDNLMNWTPAMGWGMGLAVLILVVYYVFMARTVLQMLRVEANPALLVFTLLALIPLPPILIMGIVLMIIWSLHNKAS
ncbi:MAG: hypothetical protein O7E56_01035 [SAR324 cluster bacterium]|nr:hypothetical protein [SAR324 cluster bacterium]